MNKVTHKMYMIRKIVLALIFFSVCARPRLKPIWITVMGDGMPSSYPELHLNVSGTISVFKKKARQHLSLESHELFC